MANVARKMDARNTARKEETVMRVRKASLDYSAAVMLAELAKGAQHTTGRKQSSSSSSSSYTRKKSGLLPSPYVRKGSVPGSSSRKGSASALR
jgi:hypothetical protein